MTTESIATFRRELAALPERYVDDVNVLVAGFIADVLPALATAEELAARGCGDGCAAEPTDANDTIRPPSFAEEPDTFTPVSRSLADEDELATTRGGRMVPRYPGPEELRWERPKGEALAKTGEGEST